MKELLEKFNLKVEEMTSEELETLDGWAKALSKNEITVQKVKDYIASMINSVSKEIAESIDSRKWWFQRLGQKDLALKMRLKNYLLIQDFLTSPDKAKRYLENSLSNIKKP